MKQCKKAFLALTAALFLIHAAAAPGFAAQQAAAAEEKPAAAPPIADTIQKNLPPTLDLTTKKPEEKPVKPATITKLTDQQKVLLCNLANNSSNYERKAGEEAKTLNEWLKERLKPRSFREEIRQSGLGDWLVIKSVNQDITNGFCGTAVEDPKTGARVFTYCGIDGNQTMDLLDSLATMFLGDSPQRHVALDLYESCRDPKGNNYLFGLSKGGELAAEVYALYHKQIKRLFLLNPLPIDASRLSGEQRAAFRGNKVDALVCDGDFVWMLGDAPWEVRFIRNNRESKSFTGGHFTKSIAFNEDGSTIPEPNPYRDYPLQKQAGILAQSGAALLQRILRYVLPPLAGEA
ncbi:MAG: hypothetical protein LBG83_09615 [Oscillospiraceae bacterium]|jgi:hypothetical protein|nr:hypothetical protein [Oscillospiraceae bacterium]